MHDIAGWRQPQRWRVRGASSVAAALGELRADGELAAVRRHRHPCAAGSKRMGATSVVMNLRTACGVSSSSSVSNRS
jgi:hypothetical protein